ncbi:ABC transporter permease [Fulvivirgaceae bacterium BMA12]|uniref:ABC transporter permease n=1 Tax=Agaribacillus aureus TaxID=3051825 RepID=A0ABT8L5N9_9BACT|nr:ABC transporter permease [Fulvivirgaceae bacterium BMA12]
MNKNILPPKLPLRFFRWYCHPDYREDIEGDLLERFERRMNEKAVNAAKWGFFTDVMRLFRPGIIRSLEGNYRLNQYAMFKNYFKVGFRNILKYKLFSFINVFGLAVAMSICMLIMLMLADQKSYDQFHKKKDRTYRILSKMPRSMTPNASSPFPLAASMRENYAFVEDATHLVPRVGGDVMYGQKNQVIRGYFADSSFFNVFSFDLEKGNKNTALDMPNSMIISREIADLLFADENPIGKRVEFIDRALHIMDFDDGSITGSNPVDWGSFTITGVLDGQKHKSHLKFDVLVSGTSLQALYNQGKLRDLSNYWEWYSYCYTYVVLNRDIKEGDLANALDELVIKHYADLENIRGLKLIPQALNNITPGKFAGNPPSLRLPIEAYYFLGFLALVIIISACLNYTNLSIARALTRGKEIGIRKVNGANRGNLILQFLSESVITVFIALIMANLLLMLIKPAFTGLWANQYLNFDLSGNIVVYFLFLAFALFTGLAAGTYPALHLSRFKPVSILKNPGKEGSGKFSFLKLLSIFQFVVSLFFITTSILIAKQFKHFIEFEYGFETENIINIPLQGNDYQRLSNVLSAVPGVSVVSGSEYIPATAGGHGIGIRKLGSKEKHTHFQILAADSNFVHNLGLKIVAGNNLPPVDKSDRFILVNEAAVKALGYQSPTEILGQSFEANTHRDQLEVIGIMDDFRFRAPFEDDKIAPLMIRNQLKSFNYINAKIASSDISGTVSKLEDKWQQIDMAHPFKYQFFDDQLANANRWIGDIVSIIGFIAFLAITIACLGMLGMTIYTTERRTKEVGIRKVLGARDLNITFLLSRKFLGIILTAICIGIPLSFVVNGLWLQNFPNRVDFGFDVMSLGTLILLILSLITIGSQTFIASRRDPVQSLKHE